MANPRSETRIVVLRATDAGTRAVYTASVTDENRVDRTEKAQARAEAIVAAGGKAEITEFTHVVS